GRGAGIFQPFYAVFPHRVDVGWDAVDAIFLGNSDALAFEIAGEIGFPLRYGQIERSRITWVEPGHRLEQDRAVAHGPRHRPSLIERAGEGHDPSARAAAVGRLDP